MATRDDVAKLAGVSAATVSRVINGSSKVTPQTRKRVLDAVKELGYVPNVIAKGLRTNSSYTLAFTVQDVTNPFFTELFRGICDEANRAGYFVFIYQHDNTVENMRRLLARNVDGILTFSSFCEPVRALIHEHRVPVFYIGRAQEDENCVGALRFNFSKAAEKMLHYLYDAGHRDIALIARAQRKDDDIHAGYVRALSSLHIPLREELIAWFSENQFIVQAGSRCMEELLRRNCRLTAVVCNSDWVAVGAICAAAQYGLKVPDDISIVGFDDLPVSAFTNPPLTTIRSEGYEEGRLGCRMLIRHIMGQGCQTVELKNEIRERRSVRRLLPEEIVT